MTANKRIALNIVATYGRSLYALIIGLFSARWVLQSLGVVDYGLLGVVGGLIGFVSFLNGIMAGGIARFYAVSEGAAKKDPVGGLLLCRQWFSTAVVIHTIVPIVLVAIGYPIGEWAVRNFLTIPPDRVVSCVWVWRFTCVSCFVSMAGVPYQAWYTAKQEIAELTIYSFITTTLNFLFLLYMINHPGIWLSKYAAWTCCMSVMPSLIISTRAMLIYPECRLIRRDLFNVRRFSELFSFAAARLLCAISLMLSSNIPVVIVNKYLGPIKNAAMTVGNSVSNHCLTLSSSINGAFSPAISNAAGAKEYDKMRNYIMHACTFAPVSVLLFSIPVSLEADNILRLWLRTPPEYSAQICICVLAATVLARMSDGLWMGILAVNKAIRYQTIEAFIVFLTVPLVLLFVRMGLDVVSVSIVAIIINAIANFFKLYFARYYCDISIMAWIKRVFIPIMFVAAASCGIGMFPRCLLSESFLRVVLTTICVEMVFVPLCWIFVLPEALRENVRQRIKSLKEKIGG